MQSVETYNMSMSMMNMEGPITLMALWHWIEGLMAINLALAILAFLIPLLPIIFYIRSFQKTAAIVNNAGGNAPRMLAWLLLIPVLNIAIFFVLLLQLKEAIARTGRYVSDQWWIFGFIAACFPVLLYIFPEESRWSSLFYLAELIFALLHWVKLIDIRHAFAKE